MAKRFLYIIFLILALSILLSACTKGDNNGIEDGDGNTGDAGDAGNSESGSDGALLFIENGAADFTLTYASGQGSGVLLRAKAVASEFKKLGYDIPCKSDGDELKTKYEVIIGSTSARGEEYFIDPHTYGEEGYAIKLIKDKLVLVAGSDNAYKAAIDVLISDIFKINNKTDSLTELSIKKDTAAIEKKQTEYALSSLKIAGEDINGYVIRLGDGHAATVRIANTLQETVYKRIGIWLEKVGASSNSEKEIYIALERTDSEDGFEVRVTKKRMIIRSSYENAYEDATMEFIEKSLANATGAVDFSEGFSYTKHVSTVKYSDFDAVGDGVTDDFLAMQAAHSYANRGGQTVYAEPGKTYYIGNNGKETIAIKTDTVWTGATIIIDDDVIGPNSPAKNATIFTVASNHATASYTPGTGQPFTSLHKGDTSISYAPGFRALIIVKNSTHKNFIRYPGNADDGQDQQELIIVDANGNIDPKTPVLWDYDKITYMEIRHADDKPITILGGHIISNVRAPREETKADYAYYSRGISVQRSNTTVKGLRHTLTNEPTSGSVAYGGFLSARWASDVTFEDCVLQAHRVIEKEELRSGTYDTGAYLANNVTWLRCTQVNYAVHKETGELIDSVYDENGNIIGTATKAEILTGYWGIMGSNYCKNLTYDSSRLSRFDAHCGVHNATIVNSEVTMINLIGSGKFTLEDSTVNAITSNMINLRDDYGSTWDGEIYIKNTHLNNLTSSVNIIGLGWNDHFYGYTCRMPSTVTLENLTFEMKAAVYILSKNLTTYNERYGDISLETLNGSYTEWQDKKNSNPYTAPKTVTVINADTKVEWKEQDIPFLKETVIEFK